MISRAWERVNSQKWVNIQNYSQIGGINSSDWWSISELPRALQLNVVYGPEALISGKLIKNAEYRALLSPTESEFALQQDPYL